MEERATSTSPVQWLQPPLRPVPLPQPPPNRLCRLKLLSVPLFSIPKICGLVVPVEHLSQFTPRLPLVAVEVAVEAVVVVLVVLPVLVGLAHRPQQVVPLVLVFHFVQLVVVVVVILEMTTTTPIVMVLVV